MVCSYILISDQLQSIRKFSFIIKIQKLASAQKLVMNPVPNQLTSDARPMRNGIDIVFEDIQYTVKAEVDRDEFKLPCKKKFEEKQILKGISGIAKAGQVTAIMGASGAGKTTLLNIISCRVPFTSDEAKRKVGVAFGKLHANQLPYNFQIFGDFANYVMQQDVLLQSLTVRQTLQYVAALKLNMPYEDRKKRINTLVNNLKLQKCVDTLVGGTLLKGISGGQRKRTSIAFELVSDPAVIILDQPTSGLDSLTAFIICSYLHKLTRTENKTVIMTIHQPNSQIFNLFDRLILLVGGRGVYQGSAQQSVGYFDKMGFICPEFSNPPDYFMSILHHQSTTNVNNYPKYFQTYDRQILPRLNNQIKNKSLLPTQKRQDQIPFCQRLGAILKRDFLNTARNPMVVKARIMQSIILGLFVGGVYWQISENYVNPVNPNVRTVDFITLAGLLFFLSVTGFMSSLSPVAIVFPKERVVFLKQEGARLYNTAIFYLSRTIVQMPFLIFIPLLMALILYWMIGLGNTAQQFFIFYFIFFLISFAGNSLGLLLGCSISDAKLITVLMPIVILPFILFSGFYKNRQDLPVWLFWLEYISPIKYAFISFVRNQLNYLSNDDIPIKLLSFEQHLTTWNCIFILIGICIFVRIIAYFFLWAGRTKLQ